jgi:ABC-type dipeptide/oligopeptide/nickel transport system permease component
MLLYVVRRLLQGVLIIFLVSVITFVIMRLLPGDPLMLLLGDGKIKMPDELREAIRHKWGFDRPYYEQYLIWLSSLLRGDFGESLVRRGVPVREMILEAAPVTAFLNLSSLVIATIIAIPAGIIAGAKRNSWFDYSTAFFATLGVSLPNFWVALMGIILFAVMLGWVPPYGLKSWRGYLLPVAVLAAEQMALLARVMRGSTIETLSQDYVRTARAKGLTERWVVLRHAVRNALLPVVTVVGFQIAYILSGTIVIETIFALPGIGRLFIDSLGRLDYQVVQSLVVVLAALVVIVNILTDIVYAVVDPRIRIEG